MTHAQRLIRKCIAETGSVILRLHKETPWTMNTIKSLVKDGYRAKIVASPLKGTTYQITKE